MSHSHGDTKALHDSITFEHDLEEHDSWFRHDASEPHHQEAHGGTNAWGIIGVMAATLFVVNLTAAVTYHGLFEPLMRAEREKAENRPVNAEYVTMRSAAQSQFNSYEWADASKGLVRVPLDVAKKMQMEEQRALGTKK